MFCNNISRSGDVARCDETSVSLTNPLFYSMALFRVLCWTLIFVLRKEAIIELVHLAVTREPKETTSKIKHPMPYST